MADSSNDRLLRLMFGQVSARAHLVRLDRSWLEVAHRHDAPPEVMRLVGEMSCASILLSASLKFDGSVILQIHGDGPVRLAVAECTAQLGFRSTVKLSDTVRVPPGANWRDLVNQQNMGRFSVVLDPKAPSQTPYQGIVPLHDEGVAQALEDYMLKSEQLPTRLWLTCDGDRAAGLLLQKMPDEGGKKIVPGQSAEEDWSRLVALASTITPQELLQTDATTLLHQLFWEESPRLIDDKPVQFTCSCSRTRVGKMLITLGQDEVHDILKEQGQVEVNCDFCNTAYAFDAVDCAELFTRECPPSSAGSTTLH